MNIIPKPQNISEEKGEIFFTKSSKISGDFKSEFYLFTDYLKSFGGESKSEIKVVSDVEIAKSGYKICCKDSILTISASDTQGAFYAIQTILQILNGKNKLPKVTIEDKPQYEWRGFMLDSARHFWTVADIKMILRIMASLKMNKFHWHLTDDQGWRAEIKKYPLLTEKGAVRDSTALSLKGYMTKTEPRELKPYGKGLFYSIAEMKEIVKFARDLHIDVIPEIDMPGHLVSAIACYPELSCNGQIMKVSNRWGVMDNIGCCGKEDIYIFVKNIIDELCEIFTYEYFHIGGDEVPKGQWEKCPKCQAKIKELGLKGENDLQGHFNNVIAEYLKTKGKNIVGWNEILDASNIDIGAICQWWTMSHNSKSKVLDWVSKGGKVILSLVEYVYMDHPYAVRPLKKTYEYTAKTMNIDDKSKVLGVEIPQWTEYIRDREKFDFNTFARLIAYAEVGWLDDDKKNYDDFERRLEALRGYFEKFGCKIAPREAYRGNSLSFLRFGRGWKKWRNNPNFEVETFRKK